MTGLWDEEGGWFSRLRREVDRYQLDNTLNRYQFYNCSISGDTSKGLRKRIGTELEARNHEKKKIITLISIGGKDALYLRDKERCRINIEDFENNFREILEIAENISDQVVVISGKPMNWSKTDPCEWDDSIAYREKDIGRYGEVKKQICEEKGVPFIDLMSKIDQEEFSDKLEDGVHPNSEGHKLMKELIKPELQKLSIIAGQI